MSQAPGDEDGLIFRTADPIFASDAALRVVLWNEGAERLLGYSAAEVLGRPCHEVIGCPQVPGAVSCRGPCSCQAARGGAPELVPSFDHLLRSKGGERIWVNVTTVVAASRRGLSVYVHLLRDLTRQKQIEQLFRQLLSSAATLSGDAPARPDGAAPADGRSPVTARELEVMRLLSQGASTDAIAARLGISRRTARNHIQNILAKLGVHSRLEAVAYASTYGLL